MGGAGALDIAVVYITPFEDGSHVALVPVLVGHLLGIDIFLDGVLQDGEVEVDALRPYHELVLLGKVAEVVVCFADGRAHQCALADEELVLGSGVLAHPPLLGVAVNIVSFEEAGSEVYYFVVVIHLGCGLGSIKAEGYDGDAQDGGIGAGARRFKVEHEVKLGFLHNLLFVNRQRTTDNSLRARYRFRTAAGC